MKKNLKKLVATIVCTLMLSTVLVGCGTTSTTSKPVTITYAIWDTNQQPGMQAMATAFTKLNPNIKVKIEVTPWAQYWTKLDAAATGGSLPDVFWMHTNNFLRYANNGMLMDITDKIKSSKDVSLANFPKSLVNLYTVGAKNYALPKDYDTIGLWYNKTLFDKAKVAYPNGTWNWNDYLNAAKKLTDAKAGIYGCEAAVDDQSGYYNFIYQNGGNVISNDKTKSGYDLPATQEALQFYTDLSLKYKVSPTVQQFADTTEAAYFESGKVAMGYFGSWMVSEFKANNYVVKNCDVAIIPQGKQKSTIVNGLGNVISAKTKYPEQAWKFLDYLGTKDANIIQAQHGSAIPAYNGTQQPWVNYTKAFNLKVFPEMASYGIPYPTSSSRPTWEPIQTTDITNMLSGKSTVADESNQLAKGMNAILSTQK